MTIRNLPNYAEYGNLERIESLLSIGADVNARDKHGNTALMNASYRGHLEIVKLLLFKGADINAESSPGRTSLYLAMMARNHDIIKLLKDHGAKDLSCEDTVLVKAPNRDKDKKDNSVLLGVFFVLAAFISVCYYQFLLAILFVGLSGICFIFYKLKKQQGQNNLSHSNKPRYDNNSQALIEAINQERLEDVKSLLSKGVNVNSRSKEGDTGTNDCFA